MLRNSTVVRNPESESLNSNEDNDDNGNQDTMETNIDPNDSIDLSDISGDMQPIAREFRQHYERKLKEICDGNNQECTQAKMKLQEDWIRDLTEQNEMLIKAVIELESEATQRVKMLEGKLKESAACACQVMNGWRGRVEADVQQHYQTQEQFTSDLHSLLKLLRRARNTTDDASALTSDLHFHYVSAQELTEALGLNEARTSIQAQAAAIAKDRKIEKLQANLAQSTNNRFEESDQFRLMQENYSTLKQTMQDMRDALTAEVADKHDVIVILRRDVQLLEDQCRRADQQTHFKDDIIKELRKDLKHLKQEETSVIIASLRSENNRMLLGIRELLSMIKWDENRRHILEKMNEQLLKHHRKSFNSDIDLTIDRSIQTTRRKKCNNSCQTCPELVTIHKRTLEAERQKMDTMQQHINYLLAVNQEKDHYILDLNDLISILVQNLIFVYDALNAFQRRLDQKGTCTENCPARLQVISLEKENKNLKGAIIQAQMELEQLENKTENYLDNEEIEQLTVPMHDLHLDRIPTVTLCDAHMCNEQLFDNEELHSIFIGTKLRSDCKSSSKKSSIFELESVINNLSESVSQMMMRNATNKSCNKRIQDLEQQLAESMKTKDLDIDEERNRRNVEINNLIRTIEEQEETLQSLQYQSKNLTECVNFYLNSVKILQESEDKHKAQVAQQKVTIGNLQEALMKVKAQLDELQLQRSVSAPQIDILHSIISQQKVQFYDINNYCKQCSKECLNLSNINVLLRDENLALAVEYFNNFQDKSLFNDHLQKYQQLVGDAQINITALKGTIKELKEEHNQLYQIIECQKAELRICSEELLRLQDILQTSPATEELDMMTFEARLQDTLKTNEALIAEITVLKSKLSSEIKAGTIYQERVGELQSILSDKNVEIDRWHETAVDFKRQLDQAAEKQAELIQTEDADACGEEVDVCLGELRHLKGKINLNASIYSQKMEELQSLKNRCMLQCGTIEVLRRDLKDERMRHKDEVLILKQQIRELKERDTMLDIDNRNHLDCIKHLEDKLKNLTVREQQILNESSNRETELAQRVTKSRSEEIRLVNEVTQLEQRAAELSAEVHRLRCELDKVTCVCADRQAETASMKTEVNLLLNKQGKFKTENSKLRAHVNNLQRTKRSANGDSEKLMSQLDNCLRQLEQLHGEKEYLSIQNEQLTQCICTREAELLQAQQQLEEISANRDEVCAESRTVVTNVRQWLHHQHTISEQVKDKVRRLERENRDLQQTVQEMTSGTIIAVPCRMRGGSPTRSRSSNMIYPCNCTLNSRGGTQSPASVTSLASGSSADDSSVNYSSGSENESEIKLAKQMSTPEVWLHKVENMTAELQRSNSYWKRKLHKAKSIYEKE